MKNPSIFVHQNKTRVFFERALYVVLAPVRLVARLATRDADTERGRGYDPNPVLEIILRRKRRATAEMIVYSILLTICAPITVFLWFTVDILPTAEAGGFPTPRQEMPLARFGGFLLHR